MAEVLLLHHVLGRTKGIEAIVDQLREAGYTVHVPDLFDGRMFSSLEEGLVFVKEIGFEEVTEARRSGSQRAFTRCLLCWFFTWCPGSTAARSNS